MLHAFNLTSQPVFQKELDYFQAQIYTDGMAYHKSKERGTTRVKTLTATQAAYIAGMIDGEGCISISRKKDLSMKRGVAYRLVVIIASTNTEVLPWIAEVTGVGHVKKIVNRWQLTHKDAYNWHVWSVKAAELLKQTLPYMIIKKQQALLGIEFIESKRDGVGKKGLSDAEWAAQVSTYDQMKVLNKRGIG